MKKILVAISIISLILLSTTAFLYAANNGKGNNGKGNTNISDTNKGNKNKGNANDNKVNNGKGNSSNTDNGSSTKGNTNNSNNGNGQDNKAFFSVTSSSNNGGMISPKGRQSVASGGGITFTFSTEDGYQLEWLRVDNTKIYKYALNSYTFDNVTKNHTIQAHFRKIDNSSFDITASSNTGGTISPAGITPVANGASQTYNITADSGFGLSWLKVDGVIVQNFNSTTYQFTNVTSSHTIEAYFIKISK
jgi:hypothetical protein